MSNGRNFVVWNIGDWDLFGIWCLEFGISVPLEYISLLTQDEWIT